MPSRAPFRRRRAIALVLGAIAVLAVAAVIAVPHGGRQADSASEPVGRPTTPAPAPPAQPRRPNIVFVLTDDLSWNLVQYMPHVVALQRRGMTFLNYTVTDSLCCPSRASIFTGDFPHDTHVTTNTMPDGGFRRFTEDGDGNSTFATSLQAAGYRTGLFGKYLNRYDPIADTADPSLHLHGAYVPPGWTQFDGVNQNGYAEYGYAITANHSVADYGSKPQDYLTAVLAQRSTAFVRSSVAARQPFFAEVSTFAPHAPYVPAPRDADTFTALRAPRSPAYGRLPSDPPSWLREHPALSATSSANIDQAFRRRVEDVQSVDRLVATLEQTVQRLGQSQNTIFVFSSDNGYHMGEYTLTSGKQTAFDTDVNVPLIAAGPGIPAGTTDSHIVENIDLRPTFDELGGARTPSDVDGHSLVALLHGQHPSWRTIAEVEHTGPEVRGQDPGDPDAQTESSGVPPSYDAIRTASYTYVHYRDGDREYYDRTRDPYEIHNLAGTLSPRRIAYLDHLVHRLATCHGARSCWAAGVPRAGTGLHPQQLAALCQDEPHGCWPVSAGRSLMSAIK